MYGRPASFGEWGFQSLQGSLGYKYYYTSKIINISMPVILSHLSYQYYTQYHYEYIINIMRSNFLNQDVTLQHSIHIKFSFAPRLFENRKTILKWLWTSWKYHHILVFHWFDAAMCATKNVHRQKTIVVRFCVCEGTDDIKLPGARPIIFAWQRMINSVLP